MKSGIHPAYDVTSISCLCGNKFESRSTKKNLKVEICSNCHPFYTGNEKMMDTEGRIERFRKKYANVKPGGKAKKDQK